MAEPQSETSGAQPRSDQARKRVLDQIDIWRKELINLARNNRLLYFKHTRSSTLEIIREPDEANDVVQRLLAGGGWRFFFPPEKELEEGEELFPSPVVPPVPGPDELITSKEEAPALRNSLKLLERRATQEFMDKGIWVLYLAAGMLHWIDPDTEDPAESPLLLIPVELHRDSPRDPYELRPAGEDVVLNPALEVKLVEFGIELPPLANLEEGEESFDDFLEEVERVVASHPTWEVKRRLVIAPFSFHKEVMYRDLLKNEEEVASHEVVEALAIGAEEHSALDFDPIEESELDEKAPPEDVITILDADATQRQCIAAAEGGASFVMDGPPGTGKSQTIANMIAELLAKDRTVLFVSEKAAALEVVQKRLQAAGLGDYTLELHSHKATRKEVAQRLGASLELYPSRRPEMPQTALRRLVRRRGELSQRATAMNEVRQPLGRSLHQAVGRVAQLHDLPQAPPPEEIDSALSADQLSRLLVAAEEIARAWGPVERADDFLWRDVKDARLDSRRQQQTTDQVDAARRALNLMRQVAEEAAESLILIPPDSFEFAELLIRVVKHLEIRPAVPELWLTAETLAPVERRFAELETLRDTHREMESLLTEIVGDRWRDTDPSAAQRVSRAEADLLSLPLPFELTAESAASELRSLHEVLVGSAQVIKTTGEDAETIARAFGLPTSGMIVARALDLADLGSLAADGTQPEANWFNPAVVDAVNDAAQALEPLVASFAERREELGRVFTEDVLGLDLDALSSRFSTVHTGMGKLKGGYRADKRTLATATLAGKATKETIALLPKALEWQLLSRELEEAERNHADLLGEHYYRRTDSDFGAITRALEKVRRALEIAGRHLNDDAMKRQLALGTTPDPDVQLAAKRLRETTQPWIGQARQLLGEYADRLLAAELDVASASCIDAAPSVDDLAEEGARLAQLSNRPLLVGQVRRALKGREEIASIEEGLEGMLVRDQELLGPSYAGLESTWDVLSECIQWTKTLRELLSGGVPPSTAGRLRAAEPDASELDGVLTDWYRARDQVAGNFEEPRADEIRGDLDTRFADADELLSALNATVGDIDEWFEYVRALDVLDELGVRGVIDFCISSRVAADDLPRIVERACLEGWIDSVIEDDADRLKQVRADQLDPMVDEFRKLDLELIGHSAGRVIEACNARRPRTTVGAAGIIRRQATIRSRHMPVRKLLEDAGEVAQALKPCFMMSPLTVSQFLPPSLKFDAVIFDEASQVRPSDAINCVYRGQQLIVAGDDKQLPPTSFFEAVSIDADDEWEEEQFDEFESILELARGSGGFRSLPLKWHYRSQHEDLITYSNQSFYDGRLITFPGAPQDVEDLGVHFIHVPDGIYRRGTSRDNPREAESVVERVLHWARSSLASPEHEDLTVGVVAFSEAQATCIETELDRRRQELPELDGFFAEDRLDGFFVKNLENVQGDERDVMIFSVGYGRDENGQLTMNFGPVNRAGGKRRLNVAITRARRRVEVVSSIEAGDFKADVAEGVRHLQRYLDYARRGPQSLALELGDSGLDAESPFEEEVIRVIRSWGYDVQPQVGTAGYRVDIGVRHPGKPGQFVLGVECDGWMYHSSKVARDRDRLRQEVLERLGWRIYRIWGTAWYRNRSEQEERLRAAIEQAIEGGPHAPRHRPVETVLDQETDSYEAVSLDEAPEWTVPYQVATPEYANRRNLDMHDQEAAADLRRMIMEVVSVEGPVRDEIVLRRVREAWGVGRAGSRIREAFKRSIASLSRRGELKKIERGYLALSEEQLQAVRVPGHDPEARRDVDEVPRAELQLAVAQLVRDARRVSRDELTREVARLFGWNRRGPDIARALDRTVDTLAREGAIGNDGDWITALVSTS